MKKVQAEIDAFMDIPADMPDLEEWEAGAETGIPDGMEFENPSEQAPPAATTAAHRAVHPHYYGAEYDKLHESTTKNVQKTMAEFKRKESQLEVVVGKCEGHMFCKDSAALHQLKEGLAACQKHTKTSKMQ